MIFIILLYYYILFLYYFTIIKRSLKNENLVLQPLKFSFLDGEKASFFTPYFKKIIFSHHNCFGINETFKKYTNQLCTERFYTISFKKYEKVNFFPDFSNFSLMVSIAYLHSLFTPYNIIKCDKMSSKKNTKKTGFSFSTLYFIFRKWTKINVQKSF